MLLVPCSSLLMTKPDFSLCRVACGATLQCEHQCKGTCGACFHGRFHVPCAQKCDRVLVCGHVCKSPCSAACPPCQEKCCWKCSHSRCSKNCGVECTPCQPIYNNRRYKSLVLETYKDVRKVLFKHSGQKLPTLRDIVLRCTISGRTASDGLVLMLNASLFFLDCIQKSLLLKTIQDFLAAQRATAKDPRQSRWELRPKEFKFGAEKLQLFNFQVDVIEMAKKIYNELEEKLKKDLERVLERVMAQAVCVSDQFRTEVACELSRIGTSGAVTKISDRTLGSPEAQQLLLRVKRLLKDSERYVGGLSISEEERHQIVKAMNDVRRGAWYKCPNGHIYCIADCGGAMITSTCPDCNATIGGTSHRLLANNSLASEMDGASTHAWPQ
ncbi:hypothetical protein FHG87_019314 [Trinorchestia longiramus]|nr:hypothetical protein FHG87_019314 [Trinorchestia longiramus]